MQTSPRQLIARVGIVLMAAALIWRIGLFLLDSQRAILYPFEIDYGEGIVWQQAVMIVEGRGYGDITKYPFIVFHYPPVYHLLAMLTTKLSGLDQLVSGRLLSFVATLATATVAGLISRQLTLSRTRDAGHALLCGSVTAGVCLTFVPMQVWAPLMRVDTVALAFTLGGAWFAMRAVRQPWLIHMAALLFVLAMYTRQTMISAPAACFIILLFYNRKTAVTGIVSGIVLATLPLLYLSFVTDGRFIEHILLYNVNRYSLHRLAMLPAMLSGLSIYIIIEICVVVGLVILFNRKSDSNGQNGNSTRSSDHSPMSMMMVLYFIFASLTLLLFGKSGSNINYLIEWCAVSAVLVGLAVPSWRGTPVDRGATFPSSLKSFDCLVPIAIVFHILVSVAPNYIDEMARPPGYGVRYRLIEEVRRMQKPVLSDDMVLLMKAGKQVPYESAIFAELSSQGRWDSRLIVRMIEQGRFGMIFTHGRRGGVFYRDRYPAAVSDAIDKAYPRKIMFGQFVIHAPLRR